MRPILSNNIKQIVLDTVKQTYHQYKLTQEYLILLASLTMVRSNREIPSIHNNQTNIGNNRSQVYTQHKIQDYQWNKIDH